MTTYTPQADTPPDTAPTADSALAALVLMLALLQKPADAARLRHELGHADPCSAEDIVRLAKREGVRARIVNAQWSDLAELPLPAIAQSGTGYFLVGKASDTEALVQDPVTGMISTLRQSDYDAMATGPLILMTTRESVAGAARRFDVSWFIPALVRYRGHLGEVFLASLFIQVLGLISPIFFQIVIDKVLVHKTLATLQVLAIGMAGIFIFETAMTGLRQYLFAHTTSRVDVELGSSLFRHLQALPMSYFSSRRVGDTIARVRELETIRSFLTSNAITVVLDLLFTVLFLGVMYLYSPRLLLIVLISIPCYVLISLAVLPCR